MIPSLAVSIWHLSPNSLDSKLVIERCKFRLALVERTYQQESVVGTQTVGACNGSSAFDKEFTLIVGHSNHSSANGLSEARHEVSFVRQIGCRFGSTQINWLRTIAIAPFTALVAKLRGALGGSFIGAMHRTWEWLTFQMVVGENA